MNLSVKQYKAACRAYEANYAALNQVLYDLCRRHPDHKHRDGINAKLWVIGRTYATGIERHIRTKGSQGSSLTQLADHLWQHRREVDECLDQLRKAREPLTLNKLTIILAAHGRLLQIVQPLLRPGISPRSFISKYLHFHVPAVPIYDGIAASTLGKLYPWRRAFLVCDVPAHADQQYARFVLRFWQCYQAMRRKQQRVSVKLIDEALLALAIVG
jgi:hypothetical protein